MPIHRTTRELLAQVTTLRQLLQDGAQALTEEERKQIRCHLEMLLHDLDLHGKRKPN